MQLTEDIARKVAKALDRSRRSLGDPTLLALLFQRDADKDRLIVRWGMWAAVLSYMAYGVFDWYLLPDVAGRLIALRVSLGLTFLVLIEIGARRKLTLAKMHLIAASAIVSGAVGWLVLAIGTAYQTELSHFIVFGIVFVLGANLFFNFRFALSAISSSIVALAFVGALFLYLDAAPAIQIVLAAFFINCLVFSLYLSWRLGIDRYRTFLHALRAKTQEQAAIEKGQKLAAIANTDPLTGLRNRRAIAADFSNLYDEWTRGSDEIGIILIDVDYFKRFNDRLGHQAGDDCLVRLAGAFREVAEANDAVVARYGGEEFVALCRVDGAGRLRAITNEFCRAVDNLHIAHPDRGDKLGIITISAGASMTRHEKATDFQLLLQEADRALYMSKFAGRATFTIYDPQVIDLDQSSENLSELLRSAIAEGFVSTVYQPIHEMDSGEVLGYEALMRIHDPDGRMISPAVFIPVAEQSGTIVDLGTWVINQACRDMASHHLGSVVAVNVSAVQLKAQNFPLRIAEILNRHGLSPRQLALEITERIDIVPEAQAVRNVEQLRSLGVQVWLDDFGTGYAGLGWLRRFRFDIVKIDRGFLNDCQTPHGVRMLHGIVNLLRTLGHTVLVEGVETEEQRALMASLGVDLIQGYLVGHPVPIDEVVDGAAELARGHRLA